MNIVYKNPYTKQLGDDLFLTEFNKTTPEIQIWNLKNAEDSALINFLREKSLQKITSFNTLILMHSQSKDDYLSQMRNLLTAILASLEYPVSLSEELDSDSWGRIIVDNNINGITFHRYLNEDCLIIIALEDSSNLNINYWKIGLKLKRYFLEKKDCSSLVYFKESFLVEETISFYKELLEKPSNYGIFCAKVPRFIETSNSSLIPISNSFPEQDTFLSKVWKKSHSNFLFENLNALIFVKLPLYLEGEFINIKENILSELCLHQKYKILENSKGWGKVTISGMVVLITYVEKTDDSVIFYIACPGRDPREYQDSFFETPFSTNKIIFSLGTDEDLKFFVSKIKEILVDAEIY